MKNHTIKSLALGATILFWGASAAFAQGDAEFELRPSATQVSQGQEFTVDVMVKNPSQESIISVRTWLDYDPTVLEAEAIDTSNTPFTLAAPGEDTVSSSEGKVKIGRSNIAGGMKDAEAKVATIKFKVLGALAGKTSIEFYDYQVSELGHTSVNIIQDGFPLNILSKEPEKLEIQLNPGGPTATPVVQPPAPVYTPPAPVADVGGGFAADLAKPQNLMANTGSGYVDLVWAAQADNARVGFNIYYGKLSGQYTRRHSVGNVNAFRLEGLSNNETYYFALVAFDSMNRESDYSNEVGIIVNQPLSSTAPFQSAFDQTYRQIPEQPQNGPLVGWLIFSAAGLSATILFGRARRRVVTESVKS